MFTSSHWGDKQQAAMQLPEGKGKYENPFPVVERWTDEYQDGKKELYSQATEWGEMEFPVSMIKPEIIEATNRAMALKLFDQFGVCPKTRNEDPIIVGQIVNKGTGYRNKIISFMIAWHFDTKVL